MSGRVIVKCSIRAVVKKYLVDVYTKLKRIIQQKLFFIKVTVLIIEIT